MEELAQAQPRSPLVPQRYFATGLVLSVEDGETVHPQGSVSSGMWLLSKFINTN